MIEVRGLNKRFGRFDGVQALSDVSLRVERGEIFGLLGPPGAGKTTLLRILATLIRPSEGTAEIGGFDVTLEGTRVREILGYVPQNPSMNRDMSLLNYLGYWGRMAGLSGGQKRIRITELLEFLGLSGEASEMVLSTSSYTRQRLLLAQALLTEPEVLLLDDPLAGLTPTEGRALIEKLGILRKDGGTILLSSSHMGDIPQVCDLISAISEGRVTKAQETPALLRALGEALHARVLVGNGSLPSNVLSLLKGLTGVVDVKQTRTAVVVYVNLTDLHPGEIDRVLHEEGVEAKSIRFAEIALSDVFRTLSAMG